MSLKIRFFSKTPKIEFSDVLILVALVIGVKGFLFFEVRPMDFRPLSLLDRRQLLEALRKNTDSGGNVPIQMSHRDTSFLSSSPDDVTDQEVIDTIQSIPTHY
jgi:hypothetical protein